MPELAGTIPDGGIENLKKLPEIGGNPLYEAHGSGGDRHELPAYVFAKLETLGVRS